MSKFYIATATAIDYANASPRLAALDTEELADRIRELMDHLRWIDANANVGLTVENALLRI